MIVVVGGIKGGSGKTTIATNLAVMRSSEGKKVLLVDADEQKSASDWANQRETLKYKSDCTTIQLGGKSLYIQVQKMKENYNDVIIDVGGRDTTSQRSALTIANVFLGIFQPRSLDIWTIGALNEMLIELYAVNPKLKSYAVINRADPGGTDNVEAVSILSEGNEFSLCPVLIKNRKAFANAATNGMGVVEMQKKDAKAVEEISLLYEMLYENAIHSL